ncbi:MAG TPA: ATP-binding cassette domain-containing protein [Gammaproteobacteria bacterium]|nr:ATP-binding cassette domain-containing protein [Gammaproteobacteria bacterium]
MTETAATPPCIAVENLTMAFGDHVVQRDVSFRVRRRSIFAIIGGSGSGKSTLLKHMVGLLAPATGSVHIEGVDMAADDARDYRRPYPFGVLFQGGALWSSMTVGENVALPLQLYTRYSADAMADQVAFKLALVGLGGAAAVSPADLSGGMRKRAALARALALDPQILFLDEPSAGLDPINSRRLDDLILQLREALGVTIVVVTHELASIFAIADDCIFLDTERKTAIAHGDPKVLRDHSKDPTVREFLSRGAPAPVAEGGG